MKKVKFTGLVLMVLISVSILLIAGCAKTAPAPAPAPAPSDSITPAPAPAPAPDEEKVVYFLSWGGTVQRALEDNGWAQKFEDQTGYKVVFTPKNTSAEIIAQAVAQKDNPQVDVVMCDEGPLMGGAQQGLFVDLDPAAIPNMQDLSDAGKHGNYLDVYTSAATILYNKDWFAQQGMAPPDSWADLERPEFQGKMFLPPITYTFGLYALVELARLDGGGETNIEPGFTALAKIAPGVVDWPSDIGGYEQLFQSGEAVIGVDEWVDGMTMKTNGLPIETVIPKEGTFASPAAAAIVKNAPHPKGAALFLNFLISQEFAQYWGESAGKGSFNTKVTYDPSLTDKILTADKMAELRVFDWATVLPVRDAWTERFNKIVGL